MWAYRADPDALTLGQGITTVIKAVESCFQADAHIILAECGISSIDPEKWYPQQYFLDSMKIIEDEIGPNTLYMTGKATPSSALWPESIETIHQALESVDLAYKMNNKGNIGGYDYRAISENSGRFVCDNPYPCQFDMGLLEGVVTFFCSSDDVVVNVSHEMSENCRHINGNACQYYIEWVIL